MNFLCSKTPDILLPQGLSNILSFLLLNVNSLPVKLPPGLFSLLSGVHSHLLREGNLPQPPDSNLAIPVSSTMSSDLPYPFSFCPPHLSEFNLLQKNPHNISQLIFSQWNTSWLLRPRLPRMFLDATLFGQC